MPNSKQHRKPSEIKSETNTCMCICKTILDGFAWTCGCIEGAIIGTLMGCHEVDTDMGMSTYFTEGLETGFFDAEHITHVHM